ncbi:MAG: hypothetical protein ACI4KA_01120 [Oscillospiraceae bacterium]
MNSSRAYITLNRESEWQRCLLHGLEISENCIVPAAEGNTCVMITGSVDSAEHNFCWRSLLIDARLGENIVMQVSAYASDTTTVQLDGRAVELDSYLTDGSADSAERLASLEKLFVPLFNDCFDGPIGLHGRYIWIKLQFVILQHRELCINKIKLLLRGEQMIDYLPSAYREEDGENGFLSRFLSIFDSIFFDMDDNIGRSAEMLDYRIAKGDMLRYLSEWLCIGEVAYISEAELRERIKRTVDEYRYIGVKRSLISWIRNEYGVTPNIIEHFNVKSMVSSGKDKEVYLRLFGNDPYKFFVLLPEKTFADIHDANLFMEKLKMRVPAYTEPEVVIIHNNVILDKHTYLGVNSMLSGYTYAHTDVGTRISNEIILGGSNNEQQ